MDEVQKPHNSECYSWRYERYSCTHKGQNDGHIFGPSVQSALTGSFLPGGGKKKFKWSFTFVRRDNLPAPSRLLPLKLQNCLQVK
jgi:hypothetical protein